MNTLRTTALAACLALVAAGAWAGSATETVDRTVALAEGQMVVIDNLNGPVEVGGWDQDQVRVVAIKTARAATDGRARAYLADLEVYVGEERGRLVIRTRTPGEDGGLRGWLTCAGVDGYVAYKVVVPRHARLSASTVNGDVEVSGMQAPVKASSTNGGVSVMEVSGAVDASSVNGSIKVDLRRSDPHAAMLLSTVNGSIVLFVPGDFRGYVDARTQNGSVGSDQALLVQGQRSRTRLVGSLNGGTTRLTLRTTNGSIWLRRPEP